MFQQQIGLKVLMMKNLKFKLIRYVITVKNLVQNFLMLTISDKVQFTSLDLSLIHISEPTRRRGISYAVFCLKKKKRKSYAVYCLKKKKIKKKKKNIFFFFFLMIRRPPRSTPLYSSAASDVYKRQIPQNKNMVQFYYTDEKLR